MPDANLVRNERAKLTATYFNNLAVALAAVAGLTPLVSSFQDGGGPGTFLLVVSVLCFVGSGVLHIGARKILGGLRP